MTRHWRPFLNPDAPDHLDFRDGTAFDFGTCDHGSQPPDDAQDYALSDQGVDPAPYARFPECFNIDMNPVGVEEEEEAYAFAANPLATFNEIAAKHRKGVPLRTQTDFGISSGTLLEPNPKLSKGGRMCWITPGLMLSPFGISGIRNLCPYASKECAAGCLNESGMGGIPKPGTEEMAATDARKRRTAMLFWGREVFGRTLKTSLDFWHRIADMHPDDWTDRVRKKLKPQPEDQCERHHMALRMNVLSDLPWEVMNFDFGTDGHMTVFEYVYTHYNKLPCYDYTKNPERMMQFLEGYMPRNYYLTFSLSEINAEIAFEILDRGGNVAVVFDVNPLQRPLPPLPKIWCGYPVIDGDQYDMRFLDNRKHAKLRRSHGTGLVVGLRQKGNQFRARFEEDKQLEIDEDLPPYTLTGGFVQYGELAGAIDRKYYPKENLTGPEYKQMLIEQSAYRAEIQEMDPEGWRGRGFRASNESWPEWRGIPRRFSKRERMA